ncbi:MAG: hypothetical protein WCS94_10450 [Verrucomicrobiota bacterium]
MATSGGESCPGAERAGPQKPQTAPTVGNSMFRASRGGVPSEVNRGLANNLPGKLNETMDFFYFS